MRIFFAGNWSVDLIWNPVDGNLLTLWEVDSKKETAFRSNLNSYDPNHPDNPKILPIQHLDFSCRLGVTNQGRILDVDGWLWNNPQPQGPLTFKETDPQKANGAPRTWTIRPPEGKVAAIALSSKGDRLAWIIHTHNSGPKIKPLRAALQALGYWTTDTVSLWISNLDGSDLREVGQAPAATQETAGSLCWSPSDKKISFAALSTGIWIVPVK